MTAECWLVTRHVICLISKEIRGICSEPHIPFSEGGRDRNMCSRKNNYKNRHSNVVSYGDFNCQISIIHKKSKQLSEVS